MDTYTPTECSNQNKKWCERTQIVRGKWLQIFLSFVVSLTVMADGLAVGWTAFTIADIIENNNNNKTVTLEHASLIGTLPAYASLIPLPFVMYSAGKIGRKWTILWGSFFTLICWTLLSIVSSDHLTVIYIAVICRGISNSVHYPITQIYSAETAQANIRGILGTFIPVLMNTGILLSYICTIYISIQQLALVGVVVISVHFLLFITAPKTPYFFILKNKPQKAKIALRLLRDKDNIAEEFYDIKETAEQNMEKINLFALLKNLYNLKLLLIVSLLQLFQQLTGIDGILMFLQVILGSSNDIVSNSTSSILLSIAKTISCIVALGFMEKLGRRILLIFSSVSTTITLTALGVYFYVKDVLEVDVSNLSWMPTMLLILFIVSYNLGFGSVVFVLGIEMLPTRLRAFGSMLIQIIYAIGMAVTTNIFAWLKDTYGFYAAFWFLSINTFVGLLFIYYFIVETKGKSLKQIQDDNK